MHPAFSVIFFTVVSGCGYGVLFLLGLFLAFDPHSLPRTQALFALAIGVAFAAAGLTSSTLHLGKPLRAWRAFSQWRSSWLSREGVSALCSFVPAVILAVALWGRGSETALRLGGAALATFAIVTVACTAQIYASLKTIHAWRNTYVLPGYLLLALLGGSAWWQLVQRVADASAATPRWLLALAPAAAFAGWLLKRAYWRYIDTTGHDATPASATGLGVLGAVRTAERPHTEANYLTNEMGFVLARKHASRLRAMAALLFGVIPVLLGLALAFADARAPHVALFCATVSAASATAGLFVERWLFFAEAKHVVMLYYGAESA